MDDKDTKNKKEFLEAILNQNVERLSILDLSGYVDLPINLRPFDSHVTAFEVASNHGYPKCIQKLNDLGIDLFRLNTTYKRALLRASLECQWECVRLLAKLALFDWRLMKERQGLEELINATERSDFDEIKRLLKKKLSPDWIKGTEGVSLLSLLIFHNCPVDIVQLLVDHSVSLNGHDHHGFSPLMSSVIAGSASVTAFLLEKGVDKNSCDKKDASLCGCDKKLKENLTSDVVDGEGKTALMYAVNTNKVECIDLLLKSGADIKMVDEGGLTALMHAARGGSQQTVRQILDCGEKADVNTVDKRLRSALIHAAYSGHVSCVDELLAAQADRYCKDCFNRTALMAAVISENSQCVERLLAVQSVSENLGVIDTNGKTCIMMAAESGKCELLEMIVTALIVQPAKRLNMKDPVVKGHLESALFSAVKVGACPCVELLLRKGCRVNCFDSNGETPLMLACQSGGIKCFKLLLKHGADLSSISQGKKNSMIMYAGCGDSKCLMFLITMKKDLNIKNKDNETALMLACAAGKRDNCCLLVAAGADIKAMNHQDQSALTYAAKAGHTACLMFLCPRVNVCSQERDKLGHCLLYYTFPHQECCRQLITRKGSEVLVNEARHRNISKYDLKTVPLQVISGLMGNKICLWEDFCEDPVRLYFCTVLNGLSYTNLSQMFPGKSFSFLRLFSGGNANIIRYLLGNLYFTVEDYKTVTSDEDFKRSVRECGNLEIISILDQLTSQPCSLQTLCLVNISTFLHSYSFKQTSRELITYHFSIPKKFKRMLEFKGLLSKLCPSDWDSIGNPPNGTERQSLLSATVKNPIWPHANYLVPCRRDQCICNGLGLAVSMKKKVYGHNDCCSMVDEF